MKHFQREFHEGVALCHWWAFEAIRRGMDQRLLIHIGNETGGAGPIRGHQNKLLGVRAGVFDYFLFVPRQGYHGLALELKVAKTGRVSPAQKEMMKILEAQGYVCRVCYGWGEARDAIDGYLGK